MRNTLFYQHIFHFTVQCDEGQKLALSVHST